MNPNEFKIEISNNSSHENKNTKRDSNTLSENESQKQSITKTNKESNASLHLSHQEESISQSRDNSEKSTQCDTVRKISKDKAVDNSGANDIKYENKSASTDTESSSSAEKCIEKDNLEQNNETEIDKNSVLHKNDENEYVLELPVWGTDTKENLLNFQRYEEYEEYLNFAKVFFFYFLFKHNSL